MSDRPVSYCMYCVPTTAAGHDRDCPCHPENLKEAKALAPQVGWICPVCGAGNAPWSTMCLCRSALRWESYPLASINDPWEPGNNVSMSGIDTSIIVVPATFTIGTQSTVH